MSDSTPSSTSSPIYADRNTGVKFADANEMVNAYLARFVARSAPDRGVPAEEVSGGPAALDEGGYAQLQHGSATIGVNVLGEQGVLMVFAPVMPVPALGREAFYRRLLELSFVATADASFAINTQHDEVVVRCLRRLSALDYEEFGDIVATVGAVADQWDDALLGEFGAAGSA